MNSLTHTEAKQVAAMIEAKAEEVADKKEQELIALKGGTSAIYHFIDGFEEGFKLGGNYATSDPSVLTELLQPLAEFLLDKCWRVDKGIYQIDGEEGQFTTEELLTKYIQETIKPKQDGKEETRTPRNH